MKLRPWHGVAALMVAVVLLRIFPGWSFVVRADREPRLPDPDAYYHFRQAAYAARHFPHLMRFEDSSLYPLVMRNDAAGLYDLVLAGLAKLVALSGLSLQQSLWWVCVWFPPLCVAAILPFVYLLVRRQGSVAIGLWMALWYVLVPGGTLTHMTIGVSDHHVVEMLLSVVSIYLLHRLVAREREIPTAIWKPAWGAALPLVIILFTWIGGPLFLPIIGLAGAAQLMADVLSGVGARPMVRAGIRYWLAFFLMTAAAGLIFPGLILLPELWRASLAGAIVVLIALPAAAFWFETPRLPWKPGLRLAVGAAATLTLTAVALWLLPHVRELLGEGLGQKSTLVAENHQVDFSYYFIITGLPGLLGWLAPVVGVVSGAWRRPSWWIAVVPSLLFVILWCHTYDYVYQGALHCVLLTGYAFGAVRWSARAGQVVLAILTGVILFLAGPADKTVPLWLPSSWYVNSSELPSDGWVQAMHWLRESTPAPPELDFSAPQAPRDGVSPRGQIGVMTDWSAGQFVNTLAGRPSTASRYPEAEGIAPFFLQSEAAVRAAPLRGSTVADAVRYVVLDPRTLGEYFGAHIATLGQDLAKFLVRERFVDGRGHTMEAPSLGPLYEQAFAYQLVVNDGNGLAHFRLVYESRQESFLRQIYNPTTRQLVPFSTVVLSPEVHQEAVHDLQAAHWKEAGNDAYFGHLVADVKIFEQVKGARIVGQAPPLSHVTLEIPLRVRSSGRVWRYRQAVAADGAGHFALMVPYATERAPGDEVEPLALATLSWGEGASAHTQRLRISEAAVEQGELIH